MAGRRGERTVITVQLAKASRSLADYVSELGSEAVIVAEGDRPVAVLVPLPNQKSDLEKLMDDPRFLAILESSRAQYAAGDYMTHDEVFPPGEFSRRRRK